jgi:hypothetical protein
MSEFARADTAVGFIDCDVDGVKIGSSYDKKILAMEFYFKGERHTIWLGMESGVAVIERDSDEAEIFRGNLNETHRSTYRGGTGASQEDQGIPVDGSASPS